MDNEKGLAVDFQIISTSLDNEPVQQGLEIDFGDIAPFETKVVRWLLSSLAPALKLTRRLPAGS